MRIDLRVPYAQKDEAKTLGARWDAVLKTWWVTGEAMLESPGLARWAGADKRAAITAAAANWLKQNAAALGGKPPRKSNKSRKLAPRHLGNDRSDFSLPDCGCAHTAPWEDCEHTIARH